MQNHSESKCLNVRWEGRANCLQCAIRKQTLFADLNVQAMEPLLRPIQQYRYPAGKLVYAEGVVAQHVFVVRKGLLKLEETLHDGNLRIVRLVEPGQVAGIEALLDHSHRYDHNATALQSAEVCEIPYVILHRLAEQHPVFFETLMEHWHHQLHAAEQVIVEFSTGTVRERVARALLKLIDLAEAAGEQQIHLLGVRDMSALTGVTRESISRVMAEFKRTNMLVKQDDTGISYNRAGLQRFAWQEDII